MKDVTDHRRLAVRVTKDALRQIKAGHPWVYDSSITRLPDDVATGDLAVVFDEQRRFRAIGLYDADSPIAIRILHSGQPLPIDQSWFNDRVESSLALRSGLTTGPAADQTTAFRLIHGENDGLSGLVVDIYDRTAVMKLYSAAWFAWLPEILVALSATVAPERVVLRLSRQSAGAVPLADGSVLFGPELEGPVRFLENGLWFAADLAHGHKTGHFLDQRENRALLGHHSAGATVLDVFSCTGGFALNAAARGAETVTATDLSPHALEALQANATLNDLPITISTIIGDAFDVMDNLAKSGRRFDLVIVDPPSFAQKADQVSSALGAYRRLARLAAELTGRDGLVYLASCSSRVDRDAFVAATSRGIEAAGRRFVSVAETGHAVDHPVDFVYGEYLKGRLLQLDG